MPAFGRPRRLWVVAVLLLSVAALGVGLAVRADREEAAQVIPYDPLPRW
jgi:hypothetical protein